MSSKHSIVQNYQNKKWMIQHGNSDVNNSLEIFVLCTSILRGAVCEEITILMASLGTISNRERGLIACVPFIFYKNCESKLRI